MPPFVRCPPEPPCSGDGYRVPVVVVDVAAGDPLASSAGTPSSTLMYGSSTVVHDARIF